MRNVKEGAAPAIYLNDKEGGEGRGGEGRGGKERGGKVAHTKIRTFNNIRKCAIKMVAKAANFVQHSRHS